MTKTLNVTTGITKARSLLCFSLLGSFLPRTVFAVNSRTSDEDTAAMVVGFLFLLFIGALAYAIPTFIAFFRGHPNRWIILLVNLFFGGTGIGWLAALIWALHKVHDPVAGRSAGGESGLNLFANDVKRMQLEPAVPTMKRQDYLEDLERLANLYSAGHLSEVEYTSQKRRILESSRV